MVCCSFTSYKAETTAREMKLEVMVKSGIRLKQIEDKLTGPGKQEAFNHRTTADHRKKIKNKISPV